MHPLDKIKSDAMPELWAPKPSREALHVPAPGAPLHFDERGHIPKHDIPQHDPEKPSGSHVIVIDIS